ncbi:hypothetical protein HPP92_009600 [Vanilla planifolia]|uniref:Calmodulin-binding family protein n=1 Tax=Vanilla planifolia TaxID=51239 RepID=A0A835RAB8_VANPL|nr:hypothetical protein HPP92_009600 [Vanilla planifolia]
MGFPFPCPGSESKALDGSFDGLPGSICLTGDYAKSNLCPGNPTKRKKADAFHLESNVSFESKGTKRTRCNEETVGKHAAALKLQKVYKSFRTRRQLADCAVLVEQRWWKLLDFALLKRSSVSFFDISKPESAVSKWARARTRAAKVGKGLSKNAKGRKLALQHWLEAIDPRHRYGHNLHLYYDRWLRCESSQPFFYWLDVGEGKEVDLEACSRSKLQQQCIKYLGPKEREAYEVIVEDGVFLYKKSRALLDTARGQMGSKWIFVLSTSKSLYVGLKEKGKFQHSSFLAGGAASAAGRLVVDNGVLKAVWPHSGHYRPTEENFEEFMSFLVENNVDLSDVKRSPDEEDDEWGGMLHGCSSESDSTNSAVITDSTSSLLGLDVSSSFERVQVELEKLSSFNDMTMVEDEQCEEKYVESCMESNNGYETPEQSEDESVEGLSSLKIPLLFQKPSLFIGVEDGDQKPIHEEPIIQRISSEKVNSCQLGQNLPFKWTTGAGPRIGYVRNHPSEIQYRALKQVNLSPRGAMFSRPFCSNMGGSRPWPKTQEKSTL